MAWIVLTPTGYTVQHTGDGVRWQQPGRTSHDAPSWPGGKHCHCHEIHVTKVELGNGTVIVLGLK